MFLQSGKVSEQVGNIEVRDMGTERTDNGIAEGHWRRLHTQRRMEKRDTTLSREDKKVEERRGDESRSN